MQLTGNLLLTIVSANLNPKGPQPKQHVVDASVAGSAPNPYCTVLVDGVKKWKTRPCKSTTSPKWSTRQAIVLDNCAVIQLLVKDRDFWKADDSLGSTSLSLSKIANSNGVVRQEVLQLQPVGTGELVVSYSFIGVAAKTPSKVATAGGSEGLVHKDQEHDSQALRDFESLCPLCDPAQEYDVLERIGRGGFGYVHRVVKLSNNKTFALKAITASRLLKKSNFATEVLIQRSLHHPNIVLLNDVFRDDDHYYIVMELLTGGDLFDEISRRASFTEVHASQIVYQLLDAVSYLHLLKVVHRDIKPENILLQASQHPDTINIKVCDFGLSYSDRYPLYPNTICGTPSYMAPELISGHDYNFKIDEWACGVIMYILLSGCAPFQSRDRTTLTRKICVDPIPYPPDKWKGVNQKARALLTALLTRDPTQRESAETLLTHDFFAQEHELSQEHMATVHSEIKKFNARRTLRSAYLAVKFGLSHNKSRKTLELGDSDAETTVGPTIAQETEKSKAKWSCAALITFANAYLLLAAIALLGSSIIVSMWVPHQLHECAQQSNSLGMDATLNIVGCLFRAYIDSSVQNTAAATAWCFSAALSSLVCMFFVLERGREHRTSSRGALQVLLSSVVGTCVTAPYVLWRHSLVSDAENDSAQGSTSVVVSAGETVVGRVRPRENIASPTLGHVSLAFCISIVNTAAIASMPVRALPPVYIAAVAAVAMPLLYPLLSRLLIRRDEKRNQLQMYSGSGSLDTHNTSSTTVTSSTTAPAHGMRAEFNVALIAMVMFGFTIGANATLASALIMWCIRVYSSLSAFLAAGYVSGAPFALHLFHSALIVLFMAVFALDDLRVRAPSTAFRTVAALVVAPFITAPVYLAWREQALARAHGRTDATASSS